jgi:hypothetical protein
MKGAKILNPIPYLLLLCVIQQPIMKKISIIVPILLAVSFIGFGQDTTQLKRTPYKLFVAVDKQTFYEEELKEAPFVLPDNTVQLYPGETVYIEVLQEDGIIKKLTAVKAIKNPAITLTICFTQTASKKVHEMMMLKVVNPFTKDLNYGAAIFLTKQNRWTKTSVVPVMAGLTGFETWPDVITTIGLNGWTFEK